MAKTPISIRLDSDLVAWFKAEFPDGYQPEINAALRAFQRREVDRRMIVLGRAKQAFLQYHAKCFWHLRKDLNVTWEMIPIVREGLRKYGGIDGMRLADELMTRQGEDDHAHHSVSA